MADPKIKILIEAVYQSKGEIDKLKTEINALKISASSAQSPATDLGNALASMATKAGVAMAAYMSLSKAMSLFKDSVMIASRVETLGVVVNVVGKNAGYTAGEMSQFTEGVKKMGITTQEALSSVTKMAQAGIDLAKSQDLARIAQDAAVIGNTNSSEALGKMVHGIQSAQIEVLRTIGINVNFENSYKKLATELDKNVDQLTEAEKVQARTNVVMEAGARIAGTYEAAMGTAGKQLTSLARYSEEALLEFGKLFTPAFSEIILAIGDNLKAGGEALKELWSGSDGQQLSSVFKEIAINVVDFFGTLKQAVGPIAQIAVEVLKVLAILKPWELAINVASSALKIFSALLQPIADLVTKIGSGLNGLRAAIPEAARAGSQAETYEKYLKIQDQIAQKQKEIEKTENYKGEAGLLGKFVLGDSKKLKAEKEALELKGKHLQDQLNSLGYVPETTQKPKDEASSATAKEKKGRSKESIALAQYNNELRLADKFTRDNLAIIESGKDRELAVLENKKAKGLVSQLDYEQSKLDITKQATSDEDAILNDHIGRVSFAFDKMQAKGLVSPEKIEEEASKVTGTIDQLTTSIEKNLDKRDILEIQADTKRTELNNKEMEMNDQTATSYSDMSNKIAKTIDDMKVKNGEMLPGEALLAEHEREVNALAEQAERALERIKNTGAVGSEPWLKAVQEYKLIKAELIDIQAKTPGIKKEAGFLNEEEVKASEKAILSQKAAITILSGSMDEYNRLVIQGTIAELESRKIRATPEETTYLQTQIDFHKENLAYYEQYGPALSGFRDGLRELGREAGDTKKHFEDMAKGMVTAFSSSVGTMIEDWLKFDGNFMKDLDALKDYWKDFWGKLVNIFVRALEEMAIKWAATAFLRWIFGDEAGGSINISGGGGSGSGGSGGGVLGMASTAATLYGYAQKAYALYTGASAAGAGANVAASAAAGSGANVAGGSVAASSVGSGGAAVAGTSGASTGASTAASASTLAAIAPYIYAVGAAFVTYKIIEGVSSMGKDLDKKAKMQIGSSYQTLRAMSGEGEVGENYNKGEYIYGQTVVSQTGEGTQKRITIDSSNKEKADFAAAEIARMKSYRDQAKLTNEELQKLIDEALAPMGEEVKNAAIFFDELSGIMDWTGEGYVASADQVEGLKKQLSGMSKEAMEAVPYLEQYGGVLRQIGVDYDTYNSEVIDAALLINDLATAQALLTDGLTGDEPAQYAALLETMKAAFEQNGESILKLIPNIGDFIDVLKALGYAIDDLPKNTDVNVNANLNYANTQANTTPSTTAGYRMGGAIGRYASGGFLRYNAWGGSMSGDEVPIIAHKGEYVLSKEDVAFVDKIKSGGFTQVNNIPPILPKVNVVVNNQSGAKVQSAGAVRMADDSYIIDVLLKDIHAGGRLRTALSFV